MSWVMLGQLIGNYRLLSVLGEGGMGVVYLAEHVHLGRRAAIKLLLPELSVNADAVARFFNEAKATTMLRHPGLPDVYDFGYHTTGAAYIAMELLEGESLAGRLRRERMPLAQVPAIGRAIAEIMAAAHDRGIVHRDLKPDNVFLVPAPGEAFGLRVKVLDFGIAKLATEGNSTSTKTRTGSVLGTPMYMSPEQCRGAGEVDHRSDLYSLGCILFEMVCGRTPFQGEGPGDVIAAHLREPAPSPRLFQPHLPRPLERTILSCLAKRPDERPQSMRALVAALAAALHSAWEQATCEMEDPHLSPRVRTTTLGGATGQVEKTRRRRPGSRLGFPAALLVAGAAAAALFTSGGPPAPAPAAAPAPAPVPPPAPAEVTLRILSERAVELSRAAEDQAVPTLVPLPPPPPPPAEEVTVEKPSPPGKPSDGTSRRTRRHKRIKDGTIDPFGGP